MKTFQRCISISILFLTSITNGSSQPCPGESVNFIDQFSVDQFIIEYPDCEILNNLKISGSMTNLNALSNIRVIKGDLIIEYNSELEDLAGLDNLDTVYGNVMINQNLTLASLESILDIKFIGGMFSLSSNEVLMEIDTFLYLDSLNSLSILNSRLSTLSAFSQLRYAHRFSLTENHLITNLDGLGSLQFVQQIQLGYNSQ